MPTAKTFGCDSATFSEKQWCGHMYMYMYIHSSSSIYLRATSFRAYVMVKNCAYLVYPETAITPSVYQGAGGFPLLCLNKRSNSVLWQNGIYHCNRKIQIFLLKYTWISKFWSQVMLIIFQFKHQRQIYWNTCWWGQQTKLPDFSQTLTAKYKLPWFATKYRFSLTQTDWNFPDFSLTVATLN